MMKVKRLLRSCIRLASYIPPVRKFAIVAAEECAARKASGNPAPSPGSGAPILLDDPFVRWLTYANAGMLHGGNVYCFDYAIRNLPSDSPIVEIGSFCGLSANVSAYFMRKHARMNRLYTVDPWNFEGPTPGSTVGESTITLKEYQEFVLDTFRRNIDMFSGNDRPYSIELTSDQFFGVWREGGKVRDIFDRPIQLGGPISFSYIDGNHAYEFAKRDFENVDAFLERGGFILFDDSADGSGWEVCRVVDEVKASGRYEVVIANPNYLFRKK